MPMSGSNTCPALHFIALDNEPDVHMWYMEQLLGLGTFTSLASGHAVNETNQ